MSGRKAVFFDRDGTLNEEVGHISDPALVVLLPGAVEAVRRARAAGFLTALVTNQSGVARGLFGEDRVRAANTVVVDACGGFDGVYWCPHHPRAGSGPLRRECDCRKPGPGMLLAAERDLGIDLGRSFLIGDSLADVGAAQAVGASPILVLTGKGAETARAAPNPVPWSYAARDALAAVDWAIAAVGGAA